MIKLSNSLNSKGEVSEMDIKNVMEALDASEPASAARKKTKGEADGAAGEHGHGEAHGEGGEGDGVTDKKKSKDQSFDEMMRRVEKKLEKATAPRSKGSVGNLGKMFRMLDKHGDGTLHLDRVEDMLRHGMRIDRAALGDDDIAKFVKAVDEHETGAVDLAEIGEFAAKEMRRMNPDARVVYAWRKGGHEKKVKAAVADAKRGKKAPPPGRRGRPGLGLIPFLAPASRPRA